MFPTTKVSNVEPEKSITLLTGSKRLEANFHFPESEASLIKPVWYCTEELWLYAPNIPISTISFGLESARYIRGSVTTRSVTFK